MLDGAELVAFVATTDLERSDSRQSRLSSRPGRGEV